MKENLMLLINVLIFNCQDFQTRSEIKANLNMILKKKRSSKNAMKKSIAKLNIYRNLHSYWKLFELVNQDEEIVILKEFGSS